MAANNNENGRLAGKVRDHAHQRPRRTQIMTLSEVAKYLGIHQVTVYRLIKETDIPAIKLRGQWRFKKDLLDNWLQDGMYGQRSLAEHSSKE
jgi:excisionase family DNA binding protein